MQFHMKDMQVRDYSP